VAARARRSLGRLCLASAAVLTATGVGGARAGAAATPPDPPQPKIVARSIPASPVGRQLAWFLKAVAATPLSQQTIKSHFDSNFLAHVDPDQLNAVLGEFDLTEGASFVGLLRQSNTSLVALADFGSAPTKVTMSVDSSGLIAGLLLSLASVRVSSWTTIDHSLAALGPDVGFLAARVSPHGACQPVHAVASETPRPLASQFKLFVLGALANGIAGGRDSWQQTMTVQASTQSIGNAVGSGSLQFAPVGSSVSVEQAATKMISISDNTAADMLIGLVGRTQVETQVRQWSGLASDDEPFLTTRQMFLLHYVDFPALADRYLTTPRSERAAFLSSSVDPLPLSEVLGSPNPRDVEKIEWFASPDDICRAFAGLQLLSKDPRLSPLSGILSRNRGDIGLDPSKWHTIWFKGGSEPGVLTLGYVATNTRGQTFVVESMVSNPQRARSRPQNLWPSTRGPSGCSGRPAPA
jgi:beta-lactamase class A